MADNNTEQELRDLAEALSRFKGTLTPAEQEIAKLEARAKEVRDAWGKYLKKDLVDTVTTFGKTMVSGTDSMAKYSGTVDLLTSSTKNLLATYGTLGKGIGTVVEVFGKLVGGSLEQYDALEKTYRSLSNVGVFGESFSTLRTQFMDAGLDIKTQGDLFAKVIKENASQLQLLGGTVSGGVNRFIKITEQVKQNETALARFGIGIEEAYERTGKFVSGLVMSGAARGRSDRELGQLSAQYMMNLTALNDITGKTRDQAEREQKERENDLRFQMARSKMSAEQQANMDAALSVLPKELQKGFISMFVNGGKVVDEAGVQFYQQLGTQSYEDLANIISKTNPEKATEALVGWMGQAGPKMKTFYDRFEKTIAISNDALAGMGANAENYIMMQKYMATTDPKVREELLEKMKKAQDKSIKQDTDVGVERRKIERLVRGAMEELYENIRKLLLPALDLLNKGLRAFGNAMAEVVYWLTSKFGKAMGIDVIDMRGLFDNFNSLEDATKGMLTAEEKKKALTIELNKLLEEENNEKTKAELQRLGELRIKREQGFGMTGEEEQDLRVFEERERKREEKKAAIRRDIANQEKRSEMARGQASAYATTSAGAAETTVGTEALAGLTVKKGDVQAPGATVDPKLVELAKRIQTELPGFAYFSGFNDKFHQEKSPSSIHTKGKALDFVLNYFPTKEQGEQLVKSLKEMGFDHVIDEYNNPSSNATAPHIHAQLKAKTGGIFSGPEEGYWVQLHGKEKVSVEPEDVSKSPLSNDNTDYSGYFTSMNEQMSVLASKLDDLIEYTRRSANTQEEILTYTRV